MTLIDDIKRDRDAGTPPEYGGWFWNGHGSTNNLSLATQGGGRHYVMDFERWGMRGAQPRFQPRGKGMVKAASLLKFQVGDGTATGMEEAKADEGVYRYDIVAIDNPDARRIAHVPAMEEALLAAVELEAVVDSIFGSVSMGEELDSAFIDVKTSDLDRACMALASFRKALEKGNE